MTIDIQTLYKKLIEIKEDVKLCLHGDPYITSPLLMLIKRSVNEELKELEENSQDPIMRSSAYQIRGILKDIYHCFSNSDRKGARYSYKNLKKLINNFRCWYNLK
jgi:hypothetical protein